VVIGISVPTCVACFGQVVLACVMCCRPRRLVMACMLCVLVLMTTVWILVTLCFPLGVGVIHNTMNYYTNNKFNKRILTV
jgi:hypothetical protein